MRQLSGGEEVEIEYWRDGVAASLTVALGEQERCAFDIGHYLHGFDLEGLAEHGLEISHEGLEALEEIDWQETFRGLQDIDWEKHLEGFREIDIERFEERMERVQERLQRLEENLEREQERLEHIDRRRDRERDRDRKTDRERDRETESGGADA